MIKDYIIRCIKFSFNCLLLAFFLVALPVPGFGNTRILSGFIIVLILLACWYKVRKKILLILKNRSWNKSFFLLFLCFVIALLHTGINGEGGSSSCEYFMPRYIIYIILFSFIVPLYCVFSFSSLKGFVSAWLLIILAESLVVLMCVVDHDFAVYVFNNFYESERFEKSVERGMRIVGIGIAGSSGGIAMSTGIMALSFLYLKKRISSWLYILLSLFILLATLFVGRTGVLCALAYIVSAFIFNRQTVKFFIYAPIALIVLFFGLNHLLNLTLQGDGLYEWMSQSFQSEAREEVLGTIYSRYNLPWSLIGTGMTRGKASNGAYCDSDSGYLQTYFTFGIIGFICYYCGLYLMMRGAMYKLRGGTKLFLFWAVVVAFAIETKEGFFLKYVNAFIVVTLSLFENFQALALERIRKE